MLKKIIRNRLLTSLVCVLGIIEISHADVGVLRSPGTLSGIRTIGAPGDRGSLIGGGGIGNLYSAPQGSGVLSTSINRAPQYDVLRTDTTVRNTDVMRSNISLSSGSTQRRTGSSTNTPAMTDISKIPHATPNRSGTTQSGRRIPSSVGAALGSGGVLKSRGDTSEAPPALLENFAGATYVAAIKHKSAVQKDQPEETITTLVPENPGIYRDKMEAAETAFSNREFSEAVLLYDLAAGLSSNSPESLLGMMHTYFAASTGGYSLTALYLKNTLECFPELPLVNIDLKSFYSDPLDYRRDISRLEKYVRNDPKDASAQFVLGYFLWREGEINDSKKALTAALKYSGRKELNEAIDTLWSGMLASGKVSGKLQVAENPKPESQEDKKATPPSETDKSE